MPAVAENAKLMSIESDICLLTQSENVSESLLKMGILSSIDEQFSIVTICDWERRGAETYSYIFDVVSAARRRLILKACVALAVGRSIDTVVEEWLRRRSLLESHKVATPKLFGHGQGTILEEFVFHDIDEVLRTSAEPELIASELGYLAAVLVSLGFHPIQPFHDLRSRGLDVVVIDFGEDLGPPGYSLPSGDVDCVLRSLTASLEAWNLPRAAELELIARQRFWEGVEVTNLNN